MKESCERVVKVGFLRSPKKVFDEVDAVTSAMVRDGWTLQESIMESGLAKIHLFFERKINKIMTDRDCRDKDRFAVF
jgi:hypothetical protein